MAVVYYSEFNESTTPSVFSVSALNGKIKDVLQNHQELRNIWVEGEITNYVQNTQSGHIYFNLKDESSTIPSTFFRNSNIRHRNLILRNGMKIQCRGNITVFAPKGAYQFNINEIRLAGEGELRLKIEKLKQKLLSEGLFAREKKKPLPKFPINLGIATASAGAAIHDILRVARTRFPDVNIVLAPCIVQGVEAPESIIAAIEALNEPSMGIDVIICGRGGGSFEDLLAFNDEEVVRAFAGSVVPIVSAVGHETDISLTDFAADLAAPTPSAAAQLVVPNIADFQSRLEEQSMRLRAGLRRKFNGETDRLERLLASRAFENPKAMLEPWMQSLDETWKDLRQSLQGKIERGQTRLIYSDRLKSIFESKFAKSKDGFNFIQGSIDNAYRYYLQSISQKYHLVSERLQNFGALSTLKRGYALVRKPDGSLIRSYKNLTVGEEVEVLLGEGRFQAKIHSVSPESL